MIGQDEQEGTSDIVQLERLNNLEKEIEVFKAMRDDEILRQGRQNDFIHSSFEEDLNIFAPQDDDVSLPKDNRFSDGIARGCFIENSQKYAELEKERMNQFEVLYPGAIDRSRYTK